MSKLSSEKDLYKLENSSKTFTLTEDIYISEAFQPIQEFTGTLNGNQHTIHNLSTIFIKTLQNKATIQNINFSNVDFTSVSPEEEQSYCAIFKENHGTVDSVSVYNTKFINESSQINTLSVLIGENTGNIQNCTINANITAQKDGSLLTGRERDNSTIKNCTVKGTLKTGRFAGGITTSASYTNIENCTVTVTIHSTKLAAGIAAESTELTLHNTTVHSSKISANITSGAIADARGTELHNISINNTTLIGNKTTGGLIGENVIEAVTITNSNITNSTIKTLQKNSHTGSIVGKIKYGSIKINKTFSKNTTIYSQNQPDPFISNLDNPVNIKNSYANEEIYTANPPKTITTHNSLYQDVTYKNYLENAKTIQITQQEDLQKIKPADTIELCTDIHITNPQTPVFFNGTLHGNGHTITGLTKPLFTVLTDKATINNLTLKQNTLSNPKNHNTGTLTQLNYGHINNINITQTTITAQNQQKTGGITGKHLHGTIQNCNIQITFKTNSTTGGIAGISKAKIHNCTVNTNAKTTKNTGGITGIQTENIIKNCTTKGKITAKQNIGGITGLSKGKLIQNTSFIQIKAQTHTGGITGKNLKKTIQNSHFKGHIHNTNNGNIIGGITGKNHAKLQNCTNTGTIQTNGKQIGGIAGTNTNQIQNCQNKSKIQGNSNTGGLIGNLQNRHPLKNTVKNCYNKSIVTTKQPITGTHQTQTNITNIYWTNPNQHTYTSQIGNHTQATIKQLNILIKL